MRVIRCVVGRSLCLVWLDYWIPLQFSTLDFAYTNRDVQGACPFKEHEYGVYWARTGELATEMKKTVLNVLMTTYSLG